jgi:hypothetical protein
MTEARQRRFVRTLSLIVLIAAILPNVTFVGHWTIRWLPAPAAEASADGHANHCHGSSGCADGAAYGFQWSIEGDETLSLGGDSERAEPIENESAPSDPGIAPPDRPPQYA